MSELLPIDGVVVPPSALSNSHARELAELLSSQLLPYVRYVECRKRDSAPPIDVVVFEVDVKRAQTRRHDIRATEVLAAVFSSVDDARPEVLALRSDFPKVPHLNVGPSEYPRNLCLYDQPWSTVKIRWTPAVFIERIRHWLSKTATGDLHEEDQPLEPLLLAHQFKLILPSDLFSKASSAPEMLYGAWVGEPSDSGVLITFRSNGKQPPKEGTACATIALKCEPQEHGVIEHLPRNLQQLHTFTSKAGLELLETLRTQMTAWDKNPQLLSAKLILVIAFPKTRVTGGTIEAEDIWAFATGDTVGVVGEKLGIWSIHKGKAGILIPGGAPQPDGSDVHIAALLPLYGFSADQGALYNGLTSTPTANIAEVGAGALGSQVVLNMARAGYSKWSLIDMDDLLPHNLAKHALCCGVGAPKALLLAENIKVMLNDETAATAIVEDVMAPKKSAKAMEKALSEASCVLDMSASVPVARHLSCDLKSEARRISVFLNPTGEDLILLAEDQARSIALDCLEMQYYRAVSSTPALTGHLDGGPERVRYAMSCRDVTSVIPHSFVAIHAGIGSGAVQDALTSSEASIRIWRTKSPELSVQSIAFNPSPTLSLNFGSWTLKTDQSLMRKIKELRLGKLPNETGGILIGAFDVSRRIVYVVDTIPSPPDSEEWPTLYIRGAQGLSAEVDRISAATGQNLEYVGEWHSHPKGCPALPSSEDVKVFIWITELMGMGGLPALMMIAADSEERFFLGTMEIGK